MLCINAPRKPMARIHMVVSFVLVIVCTVLAFTPLFEIRVTQDTVDNIENIMTSLAKMTKSEEESESDMQAAVNKFIDSLHLDDASVSLSLFGMTASAEPIIGSSDAIVELIESFMNGASGESSSEGGEDPEVAFMKALDEVKKIFITDDGEVRAELRDFVVILAAIAGPMLPSMDDISGGMSEEDIPAMLSKAIPHIIGLVVAMLMAIIIPIVYAILFIVSLVTFLKNLREPDIGAAKLAKRMPKSIVHPLAIVLISCLSATIAYSTSVLIMAILAAVGTLINVVFTRLHSWEKEDIAYANVVQATTLVSIGAYLFLFFNILKMGVFKSFIAKFIALFVGTAAAAAPTTEVYLTAGMILIAVIFAFVSVKYLAKVLRRVSLACAPKKKGARATHLVYALFLSLVTILPMIALGSSVALLSVSPAQEYALFYGFIATCLMVLSEVVLLILRKVFGKNMTTDAIADVLCGVSVGPEADSPIAEETPVAEEASDETVALPEESPAEAPSEEVSVSDNATSAEDKE